MSPQRSPQILAKMIAYVLGRRPDEFGLVPDAAGFVRVKDLLKALNEEEGFAYVNRSHLNEVLLTVPEPPIEIADHLVRARGGRVAAAAAEATDLPKILFASVRRRAWPWVAEHGIRPSTQPQVVLCAEREMAERMGRRLDPEPIVLTVQVKACVDRGVRFEPSGENLYLAGEIPPDCFTGPALPKERPGEAREPTPVTPRHPETPGSFPLDMKKAAAGVVPPSLRRRTEKGGKIDRKRLKRERWSREKPPWRD
jgi:putative RNA 2'-phosphotransferase